MKVLKKSYNTKKYSRTKVISLKKKKTKKFIEQRNKSQKGFGQQSTLQQRSFLNRLLGPNEMVFMGDPQCNFKDCCFTQQQEQDEEKKSVGNESVIKGLLDQNKYLKDELQKQKIKVQEQNKTLDRLGQANRDTIEQLKNYLVSQNIIKLIQENQNQNLWNWDSKYLEYIEIKNEPQSVKKSGIQHTGIAPAAEPQSKEIKHELILVEEFKELEEELIKLITLYEQNKLKNTLDKINKEDKKGKKVNRSIDNIKKQITKIGLFIDKHLNKISIKFYNKNKYNQEQKIYEELRKHLEEKNIIQIQENKWKWNKEFNNIIQTASQIINEKALNDTKVNEFHYLLNELIVVESQKPSYNNKAINAIELKLQKMKNINISGSNVNVKKRISTFLQKDIKQLGKLINKYLHKINIIYYNRKKFSTPNSKEDFSEEKESSEDSDSDRESSSEDS